METELDRENLSEIFDVESETMDSRVVDDSYKDIDHDAEQSLIDNINKANDILELVEEEMTGGNMSARMAEVAGAVINSITNANKEIITSTNYKMYLQLREKLIKYKYDELKMKQIKKSQPQNQNIILANREDILKIIGKTDEPIQIE